MVLSNVAWMDSVWNGCSPGHLPGGLVMLNWPVDGNDWHHGPLHRSQPDRRADLDAEMGPQRNF